MSSPEPFAGWAVGNDPTQGDERGAYVALERLALRECGIAYGARALAVPNLSRQRSVPTVAHPTTLGPSNLFYDGPNHLLHQFGLVALDKMTALAGHYVPASWHLVRQLLLQHPSHPLHLDWVGR